VRFVEFLRTTVLLSAAVATALATITVLSTAASSDGKLIAAMAGWWGVSAGIGLWLGRRAEVSPPIASLLANAKPSAALPPQEPARTLLNRLWPLLLFAIIAGGLGFLAAQIPGIGAGFGIIWALAWRRQHSCVTAIEERDGVRFYVKRTSPIKPMELQRAPGFKAMRPERMAA